MSNFINVVGYLNLISLEYIPRTNSEFHNFMIHIFVSRQPKELVGLL